ncbi:CoA-binding protein [Curvibacter sp. CHRR-16]|uniref:CoA-binding protein n=1 Tax=Curvibacter sp. CHRR-16 TaxID=2835872 RepID=UPI001BD99485|nr:CoA-binding protein [Curvibacter sp. CHRR-16]MBT0570241.1 CoA-binding protein [Curvibacter sp. CHRR-16]
MTTTTDFAAIFASTRTIAVVGLSPKPERDSHRVARYLQQQGYRIVPIHPAAKEVLGEVVYPSLAAAAQALGAGRIDMVDVFLSNELVPPVVDEAIAIGARTLWLQIGVQHAAAQAKAQAAGLTVVHNLCTMVEHRMLGL